VTAVGSGVAQTGGYRRRVRLAQSATGAVFVAMKGGSTDGNRYVEKAIAAGALAVITDSPQKFDHLLVFEAGLPVLEVEHGRRALPGFSRVFRPSGAQARHHGHHRHQWQDDTAFLIESLLNAAMRKSVLLALSSITCRRVRPSVHTTPESRDLFELMAEGVARGASELVTEVSSTPSTRAGRPV